MKIKNYKNIYFLVLITIGILLCISSVNASDDTNTSDLSDSDVLSDVGVKNSEEADFRTYAYFKGGGKNATSHGNLTIIDNIYYWNFTEGETYTIVGILINQSSGLPLLVNGENITKSITFTIDDYVKPNGSISLSYDVNATGLGTVSVVVFTSLYDINGNLLVEHRDLNDFNQTVYFNAPKKPGIITNAIDNSTMNHSSISKGIVTIIDTVTYWDLDKSSVYTIKGILINQSSGLPLLINGKNVTINRTFTAENEKGTVDMVFTFNATGLGNISVVIFEELYESNSLITSHNDITDENQTIIFNELIPGIISNAIDNSTKNHSSISKGIVTIIDTVIYWDLDSGLNYIVKGILINQSSGLPLLINGKNVTSNVTFLANSKGSVDVVFTFDATGLGNISVVVFEELYYVNGTLITSHKNINDINQTIIFKSPKIPSIQTDAWNNGTGNRSAVSEGIVVISDVVYYWNLTAGETYIIKGTLMNKSSGSPILINGKEVSSSVTFIANQTNGSVVVYFVFDATGLGNLSVVVFEYLFDVNGTLIANHTDINDVNQTIVFVKPVYVPGIITDAWNNLTSNRSAISNGTVVIVDTIYYWNLVPGETYVINGTLMNKSSGSPILINGKEVSSSVTFIANQTNGSVVVYFVFDATGLGNLSVVVFEYLFDVNGTLIANHTDINDMNQTIIFYYNNKTNPIDPVKPDPINPTIKETTSEKQSNESIMKTTGNPLLTLLFLMLVSSISIIFRRKK